jgi:hypothetical protein
MFDNIAQYTTTEGSILIKVFIAHILSDFLFQSDKMVSTKKWASKSMALHIAVVFVSTLFLTNHLLLSVLIAISHWLIDGAKIELDKSVELSKYNLFILDQIVHILAAILIWVILIPENKNLFQLLFSVLNNYSLSLYLLGYLIIIYPISYLIKFVTKSFVTNSENDGTTVIKGGKVIGQFERIIILTFVFLSQYEAIGFLITGKSIIRFADRDSGLKSEYVLVGTMISYAAALLIGVLINGLIAIQ